MKLVINIFTYNRSIAPIEIRLTIDVCDAMESKLQEIFTQFLQTQRLFTNPTALTMAFTPASIPHREQQMLELGKILAPALRGAKPSNIFVYGKSGTGKTLSVRFVSSELERASRANGQRIRLIYTNCKMRRLADTEYRLLAGLAKEFGISVPFTGLPTEQIYQRVFEAIDQCEQIVILVIDEIDALVQKAGDEILYNLTRINQELRRAKLSLIGITNDLGFIEKLDPRVKSSLSEEEIIFPPYNAEQLADILRERAKLAFVHGALADGVIEKAAALAAQEHGDARRALDLLRVAGELAERAADSQITIAHIDAAQQKIDIDHVLETVMALPRQNQAVLWAILRLANTAQGKNIETGDVFNTYNNICTDHGLRPLTSRRVSDLIAELDLLGIISTRVISKGRYGRTRIITIHLTELLIKKLQNLLLEIFYR